MRRRFRASAGRSAALGYFPEMIRSWERHRLTFLVVR
jgi:hypothetical protein